jgi:hypothetical protein
MFIHLFIYLFIYCPVQPSTQLGPDQVNVLLLLLLSTQGREGGQVTESGTGRQDT